MGERGYVPDPLNLPGVVAVTMSTSVLASNAAMLSREKGIVPPTLSRILNFTTATGPVPFIPLISMIPAQSRPGLGELESMSASPDSRPRSTCSNSSN